MNIDQRTCCWTFSNHFCCFTGALGYLVQPFGSLLSAVITGIDTNFNDLTLCVQFRFILVHSNVSIESQGLSFKHRRSSCIDWVDWRWQKGVNSIKIKSLVSFFQLPWVNLPQLKAITLLVVEASTHWESRFCFAWVTSNDFHTKVATRSSKKKRDTKTHSQSITSRQSEPTYLIQFKPTSH